MTRTTRRSKHCGLLLLMLAVVLTGCVSQEYRYGLADRGGPFDQPCNVELTHSIYRDETQHEYVDRIEGMVQAPKRWFRKSSCECPTELEQQREEALTDACNYLKANGISDIYVDVRSYQPKQQWKRLVENDRIGPVWKYTAGSLDVLAYSLFPRRAFHSDNYSPYTNTLSINSHDSASTIFQAAQAKQFQRQKWMGSYAVIQKAPVVPLVHLSKVSTDALSYAHDQQRPELAQSLYPVSYAKLGSAVVSGVVFFFPVRTDVPFITSPLIKVTSRATGKFAGKIAADQYSEQQDSEQPANE